jgi:hypothetical protein
MPPSPAGLMCSAQKLTVPGACTMLSRSVGMTDPESVKSCSPNKV